MELVSIVIPVYNRINLISNAVDSALAQSYKNVEIIIIDNKSTDGTFEFLIEKYKHYQNIFFYQNSENIGPVNNWIKGIEHANGKYIKLLFSDDWIDVNYIEEISHYFNRASVGVFYTPAVIHEEKKKYVFYKTFSRERIMSSKLFLFYTLIGYRTPVSPGCGIFIKDYILDSFKATIDPRNHGLYLKHGAGIDLLSYLYSARNESFVVYTPKTYSHFLSHGESFTTKNNLRRFYKKAKLFFINNNYRYSLKMFLLKGIIRIDLDKVLSVISNMYL